MKTARAAQPLSTFRADPAPDSTQDADARLHTYRIALGTDVTHHSARNLAAILDVLSEKFAGEVELAARGWTSWQVRSGGMIHGSVVQLS